MKIIASDRVFYEGRCRKLVIPAPDGEKGILPNHENMVIAVKIGMARMEIEEGNWVEVALGRGFAEVVNNRVTLLVDTAEKPEEIDIRHAQEQKERAEERIRQKQSIQEYYHSQASLARAMNRLRVISGKTLGIYREKKQGSLCKKVQLPCFFSHIVTFTELLFPPISTYPCAIVVLAHSSTALRARLLMYGR